MELTPQEMTDLRHAKQLLEHPSLAVKLASLIGSPLERGLDQLPARFSELVATATRTALFKALDFAVATLDDRPGAAAIRFHKLMAAASGALGGGLGLAALPVELPISTIIMLRSIADIARSEGEPIGTIPSRLACLEVFALGGGSATDDAAETGYFAVRAALARSVSEAAKQIAERGMIEDGAPVLVRLITALAARFGVVVSEKAAAQAIPVAGAVGGALINSIFIDHFQGAARGHFTVRRLERRHGAAAVQRAYGLA